MGEVQCGFVCFLIINCILHHTMRCSSLLLAVWCSYISLQVVLVGLDAVMRFKQFGEHS